MLGAHGLGLRHSLPLAGGLLGAAACHLGAAHLTGDLVYLASLGGLFFLLARRWLQRSDLPPPSFVLVILGLVCGAIGHALLVAASLPSLVWPTGVQLFGHLLATQAFVLLPILGVGAFLLPRFFGRDSRQNFAESRQPPAGWAATASFAGVCGILIILSFAAEAGGDRLFAWLLRGTIVLGYLLLEVPAFRRARAGGTLPSLIRLALIAMPLGYALMALLPANHLALLHVVFITGFGLLTLAVASRVILGHSGQSHRLSRPSWLLRIVLAGFVCSLVVRVTADWLGDARFTHYGYAAALWLTAAIVWAWCVLPAVTQADAENPDP
jgi:uncharacterized protein involved in response to NO